MKYNLSPDIESRESVLVCLEELKQYSQLIQEQELSRRVGVDHVSANKQNVEPAILSQMARSLVGPRPNSIQLRDAIGCLEEILKESVTVDLTLTSEPDQSGRTSLINWFRLIYSPISLLSYTIDPKIGGGIIVRTAYRSHDYSYANQLYSRRKTLIEVIKRV